MVLDDALVQVRLGFEWCWDLNGAEWCWVSVVLRLGGAGFGAVLGFGSARIWSTMICRR